MSAFKDWSRKQTQRMAAEEIMGDMRLEKLLDDAMMAVENDRQSAIVQKLHPEIDVENIGKRGNELALTVLARDLLKGKVPTNAAPDKFLGADYRDKSQLGIDGEFKPDSEIRGFTKLKTEVDPEDGETLYSIEKVGAPTEFLSRRAVDEFDVLNTDRIVETKPGFLGKELPGEPADYRYVDPKGNVVVADMQTGDDSGNIKLNLFKTTNLTLDQRRNLERNILGTQIGGGTNESLDKAFKAMYDKGQFPEVYQKVGDYRGNLGVRAGKIMSDAPLSGSMNQEDQFRYEKVLFGLSPAEMRGDIYAGNVPQEFVLTDTEKLRERIFREIRNRSLNKQPGVLDAGRQRGDKIDAVMPIEALTYGTKSAEQLLPEDIMRQFRPSYSL